MTLYKLSIIFCTILNISSAKYLTARINYEKDNSLIDNATLIEFWPYYVPLDDYILKDENCSIRCSRSDFQISFINTTIDRVVDYTEFPFLPVLNLNDFNRKDLNFLFENDINCDFDTVWFEPPYRYHGYRGFKKVSYDKYHHSLSTGYAQVPFVRNVDTIFKIRNKNNYLQTTLISNNWYYKFDQYDRFIQLGRLSYLWPGNIPNLFLDSVLVVPHHKNNNNKNTIYKFFNDKVQRNRDAPLPINKLFGGETNITIPVKASFYVPDENIYVLLGYDNIFNIYNENFEFVESKEFCDFVGFDQFQCCRNAKEKTWSSSGYGTLDSKTLHFDDEYGSGEEKPIENEFIFT